jgi:hypothetical protein
MSPDALEIRPATSDDDLSAIRALFQAYAASLPVDLDYQVFVQELAGLPGAYAARNAGYQELRLDTLPTMIDAQALYQRLGFVTIPPYYDTPVSGTVFLSLML